jgi:hypothetical protein
MDDTDAASAGSGGLFGGLTNLWGALAPGSRFQDETTANLSLRGHCTMKELSPHQSFPGGIVVALCCLAAALAIIAIARGWL